MTDGWDISEFNQLAIDLGKAEGKAVKLVNLALRKSAADIERDAKLIAREKDVYDFGTLIGSISSTVLGLTAEIGPTVDYAVYQEYGTSTQPPRAFVGPAFDRHAPLFEAAVGIAGAEALF